MQTLAQQLDGASPLDERQRALSVLVDLATGPLRGVLAHRQVPYEQWDDLLAETWLIVVHKVHDGEYDASRGDPIAFVLGIVANVLRRSASATVSADLDEYEVADERPAYAASEAAMLIQQAADTLTHPEDRAVLQAILAERSISEMASAFGCSYKTAWRRYHRCLAQCRAALNPASAGGVVDAIGS